MYKVGDQQTIRALEDLSVRMRLKQEKTNSILTYLTMESVDGAPSLEDNLLFLGKIDRHDARVSLSLANKQTG